MRSLRPLLCLILGLCIGCGLPAIPPTEEPFIAPDFTLTALDGSSYTLSSLRGQWVIVTFWATTCLPCVEDLPLLQQMVDDAEEQLVVLGVNMREEPMLIQPFLDPLNVQFPILLNPYDQMLLDYNVIGLPQTLLIDPSGEVRDRRFGPVDTEAWGAILQKQL